MGDVHSLELVTTMKRVKMKNMGCSFVRTCWLGNV